MNFGHLSPLPLRVQVSNHVIKLTQRMYTTSFGLSRNTVAPKQDPKYLVWSTRRHSLPSTNRCIIWATIAKYSVQVSWYAYVVITSKFAYYTALTSTEFQRLWFRERESTFIVRWKLWRRSTKDKGLTINCNKTEYLEHQRLDDLVVKSWWSP